jgi:hypothetical protein
MFAKHGGLNLGENIPTLIKLRERSRYLMNMALKGYPKTYLSSPLSRIVFKF